MFIFVLCAEMEVDDFVKESLELVDPLENFFNHVFVMVVSIYLFIVYFLLLYFILYVLFYILIYPHPVPYMLTEDFLMG